jgi:uncharacterized membrane protein YeaQ/YmgE (transglycosylase-associated protein family)
MSVPQNILQCNNRRRLESFRRGALSFGRPNESPGRGGQIVLGTNSLIVVLLVGLISGWLASKIVDGTGLGIIADIIIGVIGAFIGRWLFSYFHIRVGVNFWVDAILTATFGAIVLLLVIRLIKRA